MALRNITSQPLSGGAGTYSAFGIGSSTGSPGTTLHTSVEDYLDEVWIWANNVSSANVTLTVELETSGGVVSGTMAYTLYPKDPPMLVVPGITVTGGAVVQGYTSISTTVNVVGYVNRINLT